MGRTKKGVRKMSIFDKRCKWCGKLFELEAYDGDVEEFKKEMEEHKYECMKKPKIKGEK